MNNDEIMTKVQMNRMMKPFSILTEDYDQRPKIAVSPQVMNHSDLFRHSSFEFRHLARACRKQGESVEC